MSKPLKYRVNEVPPVLVLLPAALQILLLGIAIVLTLSSVIASIVCAPPDDPVRSRLFCSSMFLVGLATFLNSVLGIRLPVFQGASGTFLPPLLAMQSSGMWTCPSSGHADANFSSADAINATAKYSTNYERILELQGSLMAASMFEVIVGATGLVGLLLKSVSPITISVTIILTALSLYRIPVEYCRSHWGISSLGICLLVFQSLYIARVRIPPPKCLKKARNGTGQKQEGFPIFQFFSILFTILVLWGLCALLTNTNVLPDNPKKMGYRARTDIKYSILDNTPWLIFPYPGQFGTPTFNSAIFVGFMAAVFSSILESVGDYYAASTVCLEEFPPKHAINRGILIEGFISILCGAMGTGFSTTSYGAVNGVIGLTQIASRWVLAFVGVLCMFMAIFGKFGAIMALVPDPAIGAVIFIMLGLLTAMGISALKTVDLTSNRNLSVLGISLYVGIVVPNWLRMYPEELKTGNTQADQVLNVILGTPMILGIVTSIILDNTIKGTLSERGMAEIVEPKRTQTQEPFEKENGEVYFEALDLKRRTLSERGIVEDTKTDAILIQESFEKGNGDDLYDEHPVPDFSVYDLPGISRMQKTYKIFRYVPFFQPYKSVL